MTLWVWYKKALPTRLILNLKLKMEALLAKLVILKALSNMRLLFCNLSENFCELFRELLQVFGQRSRLWRQPDVHLILERFKADLATMSRHTNGFLLVSLKFLHIILDLKF